jgi:hypothetical protein
VVRDEAILLVEDDPDDELLTRRTLKKHNVCNDVVVARDGTEARTTQAPATLSQVASWMPPQRGRAGRGHLPPAARGSPSVGALAKGSPPRSRASLRRAGCPQRGWYPPRVSPAASTAPRTAPPSRRKILTDGNSFRANSFLIRPEWNLGFLLPMPSIHALSRRGCPGDGRPDLT